MQTSCNFRGLAAYTQLLEDGLVLADEGNECISDIVVKAEVAEMLPLTNTITGSTLKKTAAPCGPLVGTRLRGSFAVSSIRYTGMQVFKYRHK